MENLAHRKQTVFLILFSAFFLSSINASGYEWDAKEGLKGWSTININNIQSTRNELIIHRKLKNLDMVIASPKGIISNESIVKIRLRTMETGSAISCMLTSGNRTFTFESQKIISGKSWKDYVFDINRASWKVTSVDRIVFRISNSDYIGIHDMKIKKPSFSDIFVANNLSGLNEYRYVP